MAFNDSVRRHDNVLLHESGMLSMMSLITVGEDRRNAKVGADKAHPRDEHVSPQTHRGRITFYDTR